MRVNVLFVQEVLFFVGAENFHRYWLFVNHSVFRSLPNGTVSEKKKFLMQKLPRKSLPTVAHLPSPMIVIGSKLSTLYRFDEYPGPDGANGAASA